MIQHFVVQNLVSRFESTKQYHINFLYKGVWHHSCDSILKPIILVTPLYTLLIDPRGFFGQKGRPHFEKRITSSKWILMLISCWIIHSRDSNAQCNILLTQIPDSTFCWLKSPIQHFGDSISQFNVILTQLIDSTLSWSNHNIKIWIYKTVPF